MRHSTRVLCLAVMAAAAVTASTARAQGGGSTDVDADLGADLGGDLGADIGANGAVLSYVVVDGLTIPEPLDDGAADADRGLQIFLDADRGGCAACHAVRDISSPEPAPGGALDGVGARLSASALRLWIVNPTILIEDAAKPAYYTLDPAAATPDGGQDQPPRAEPRLTAAEIEDVIAFLETLR